MKKLLALLLCCALLIPFGVIPAAAQTMTLPFELVAPGNVYAVWQEENDSPTTTTITYTLSNDMTAYFKQQEQASVNDELDEFYARYDFGELWITTQIDWAVDDVNDPVSGWHCNEYWNADYGFGYDEERRMRVGEWDAVDYWIGNACDTVNNHWITRGVSPYAFNGDPENGTPGLKDQMNSDQYEYRYDPDEDDGALYIDYTQHTLYFRMRFVVTLISKEADGVDTVSEHFYSPWSNVASVGKDGDHFTGLEPEDLSAPVITGLRIDREEEFNDYPIFWYTLTVSDELMDKASKVEARGGAITIEIEGRVLGEETWVGIQGDWIIKSGEMDGKMLTLADVSSAPITVDTPLEIRCRYWCYQPGRDDFHTEWSQISTMDNRVDGTWGDLDGDGFVTSTDARLALQISVNKIRPESVPNPEVADVDGDGKVTSTDARLILQYSVQKITAFPVEDLEPV